jgi:hypothetical protein
MQFEKGIHQKPTRTLPSSSYKRREVALGGTGISTRAGRPAADFNVFPGQYFNIFLSFSFLLLFLLSVPVDVSTLTWRTEKNLVFRVIVLFHRSVTADPSLNLVPAWRVHTQTWAVQDSLPSFLQVRTHLR